MKDTCIASLVSMTLALATPSVALAQPPTAAEDGPQPIRFELDASAVGDRALGLEELLREQLAPVFETNQAQLVDASRSEAPQLRVRIGGKFKDIELFKYELHFELVEGDKITKLIDPVMCEGCYDDVIVPTVAAQVPTLLEAVDARIEAVGPSESDTGDGDAGDGDTGDGDAGDGDTGDGDAPPPKPIGPIGFAGIGIAVAGLGVTIGGAVELSRGRVYEHSAGYYEAIGKDHRPVGYALIGVGASVTVAGIVMLSVDVARRAKQRQRSQAQVLIVPSISPDGAGVGVSGRF